MCIMTSNATSEVLRDYVPKVGLIYHKESAQLIFCKPKLMPLKSVTLEKLEKLQRDSDAVLKKSKSPKKEL